MYVKKRMDWTGVLILIVLFVSFYFITSIVLNKIKNDEEIKNEDTTLNDTNSNYMTEKEIVDNLYQKVRMLYDVVNSKFKVDQDDVIIMNEITYKRITNFDEIMGNLFTNNGLNKYLSDLGSYFAIASDKYYLAGNLVSYQTYYFRGDTTNIYVLDVNDDTIDAIIYEKWTSGNKNTLATIRVVKENNYWLIDNINILSNE